MFAIGLSVIIVNLYHLLTRLATRIILRNEFHIIKTQSGINKVIVFAILILEIACPPVVFCQFS